MFMNTSAGELFVYARLLFIVIVYCSLFVYCLLEKINKEQNMKTFKKQSNLFNIFIISILSHQ